jgi:hypothetical protein
MRMENMEVFIVGTQGNECRTHVSFRLSQLLVTGTEDVMFLLLESKAKGIEDVRFMLLLLLPVVKGMNDVSSFGETQRRTYRMLESRERHEEYRG